MVFGTDFEYRNVEDWVFSKKCILLWKTGYSQNWIFSKLNIFKKWIFLLENWILFNGRHNDEKTGYFGPGSFYLFLTI